MKRIDDTSFKGFGFQFIPVRPEHLRFFAFVFGEEPPPHAECVGCTMVDRDFLPAGFCLAWIRDNGTVTVHGYFGKWLKVFPKDILRGMKPVMNRLREAGIEEVWAVADEAVPGSDKLVEWFRGVATDQIVPGQGRYYRINLKESPI